jgi:CyaY protein
MTHWRRSPLRPVGIGLHAKLAKDFIEKKPPRMPATLTDSEYQHMALCVLDHIEALVDRWLDDDVIDIDTNRTGGLLELTFPNRSKIIINTQPPLHEIWMAAQSGGFHYKYSDGDWLNTRDNTGLLGALSACASEQAGISLRF